MTIKNRFHRAFYVHRHNAKKRGVAFEMTRDEWMQIWTDSGHLSERGPCNGQYVMARLGDKGAYAVGNVEIKTAEENRKEKVISEEVRKKHSAFMLGNSYSLGRVRSKETRKRISLAQRRRQERERHLKSEGLVK